MKTPWKNQPAQGLAPFRPDVQIIIDVETRTGRTQLRSGNGKPLNALLVASIAVDVVRGNLNEVIKQQAMIITPGGAPAETSPVNQTQPDNHEFVRGADDQTCGVTGCGLDPHNVVHQLPSSPLAS